MRSIQEACVRLRYTGCPVVQRRFGLIQKNILLRFALISLLLCAASMAFAFDSYTFRDADVYYVGSGSLYSDAAPASKTTTLGLVWTKQDGVVVTRWLEVDRNGNAFEVGRTDGLLFWAEDTLWKVRVAYEKYQPIDCEYWSDKELGRPLAKVDRWTTKQLPKYTMVGLAGAHKNERRPITAGYDQIVEFLSEGDGSAQAFRGDLLTIGLSVHGMVAGNGLTTRCAVVDGCGARDFMTCHMHVGEQPRDLWEDKLERVWKDLQLLYAGYDEQLYTETLLVGRCEFDASAANPDLADIRVERVETIVHRGRPAVRYLLTNHVTPACTDYVWNDELATHEVIAAAVPSLGLPEIPAWVERTLTYLPDGTVYGWSEIAVPPNAADYLDAFFQAE